MRTVQTGPGVREERLDGGGLRLTGSPGHTPDGRPGTISPLLPSQKGVEGLDVDGGQGGVSYVLDLDPDPR